jgi:hypothetical protein
MPKILVEAIGRFEAKVASAPTTRTDLGKLLTPRYVNRWREITSAEKPHSDMLNTVLNLAKVSMGSDSKYHPAK